MSIIPSPNIWRFPQAYEIENQGFDRSGLVEEAMRGIRDWSGSDVLDIGCGSGFHLPRWAQTARKVIGIEPHPPLVELARKRVQQHTKISVIQAPAQELPLADSSVDIVHARWAYFFGPGCEPGLREVQRVMRRFGVAFIIDNDATRSTFGRWFQNSLPRYDPLTVESFWVRAGFQRIQIMTDWTFDSRADFEQVVGIEFAPELAQQILQEHPGCSVDYAVNLWWRRY